MKNSFKQVKLQGWPSGDCEAIAILREEPAALARRAGLAFERGVDDLDQFWAATIRLPSQRQLLLMRYDGYPHPGTEVYADKRDNREAARAELLEALGLRGDSFSWTSDG
ncbi:MAG: hypothetical protein ACREON_12320 [Gemmatimonadaceae bacterium]